MRKLGEFFLASNRNAVIVVFACMLLPLIYLPGGFIAAIIIAFVTLQKGWRDGLVVVAWAAIPAVSLFFLHKTGAYDIILLRCVIAWMMAAILNRYQSWRLSLEVMTIVALIGIVIFFMIVPDVRGFWLKQIGPQLEEIASNASWRLATSDMQSWIERAAPAIAGMYAVGFLGGTVILMVVARWWQSVMFHPGAFRKEFVRLRMGRAASILTIVILLGGLFDLEVCWSLLPIIVLPFIVAGLALLHFVASVKEGMKIFLVILYVSLIFIPMSAYVLALLGLIGYVDSWYDFRRTLVCD